MRNFACFIGTWRGGLIVFAIATVAAYLLWAHTGHVFSLLPYLILFACPLMHIFGHGHGHHHHSDQPGETQK